MASFRKRGGKNWYYSFINGDGQRVERKGCPDRRVTEEMARAAETEAARIRSGIIDPKAERMAQAARQPFGDHLADYIATLAAKGNDPKHVEQTRKYTERVLTLAEIDRIPEMNPSAVVRALATLKARDDLSPRTINAHATAVKGFSRWLWRDGRTTDHALVSVGKLNEEADRRRVRQPLAGPDLRKLIEATRIAPPWRGMSGPDRAWFYIIGAAHGLPSLGTRLAHARRLPLGREAARYRLQGRLHEERPASRSDHLARSRGRP